MRAGYAVERVRSARRDPSRVRLEGVHALKHALRFGAELEVVTSPDVAALTRLLDELAPDVELPVPAVELGPETWAALTGRELPSPALSVARRPTWDAEEVLAAPGRVVVLEDPRHLGNVGAVIRVTAAAGAGGVLIVGAADPWHPTAVRGAAGLQFALRVARSDALPPTSRPVVALDPEGAPLGTGVIPDPAVVLFGTERGGLSATLRSRATQRVGIPMRPGVSSLNLATAVAVALYA
jgi:RNA methyltransferase, TrmH family